MDPKIKKALRAISEHVDECIYTCLSNAEFEPRHKVDRSVRDLHKIRKKLLKILLDDLLDLPE